MRLFLWDKHFYFDKPNTITKGQKGSLYNKQRNQDKSNNKVVTYQIIIIIIIIIIIKLLFETYSLIIVSLLQLNAW